MKRFLSCLLCLAVLLMLFPLQSRSETVYQLGDTMEDFSAVLCDGTEVSLYDLLGEKKAVVINFWASWCGYCIREFPFMQEAVSRYFDDIGVIALSIESSDTDETAKKIMEDCGISSFVPGIDTTAVNKRFSFSGIPFTAVVDRNGIICFIQEGCFTDADEICRLFETFIGDDYETSVLSEIPPQKPDVSWESAEELSRALELGDDLTMIPDSEFWPFRIDGDKTITSANKLSNSTARFYINADIQEGEALCFDHFAAGEILTSEGIIGGWLSVTTDEGKTMSFCDESDFVTSAISFDKAGEHQVIFSFYLYAPDGNDTAKASIRNIRLIDADEYENMKNTLKQLYPFRLQETSVTAETVSDAIKNIELNFQLGESVFSQNAFLLNAEEDFLRICVSDEINPDEALIIGDEKILKLSELAKDADGFLLPLKVSDYGGTIVYVYSCIDDLLNDNSCYDVIVFFTEDTIELYGKSVLSSISESEGNEQEPAFSWNYISVEQEKKEKNYTVNVLDENGNPVCGAVVQFCNDSTCRVETTDESGAVELSAEEQSYEVHLLTVPEEYENSHESFVLNEENAEITFTVKTK